ncbi:MAG: PEGA domain-containing protein, partial [Candidatus Eisenbacteria bacterium]
VELTLDGQAIPTRWVLVRDSTGREAHAFRAPIDRNVGIRLTWCVRPLEPDSPMMVLEAQWAGGAAESQVRRSGVTGTAIGTDAGSPAPTGTPGPESAAVPIPDHGLTRASAPGDTVTPESGHGPDEASEEYVPESASAAASHVAALEPIEPHDPIPVPDHAAMAVPEGHPLNDLPPGRPSTGIARWLQKNFGWLGHPREGAESEPATLPIPPVADPPAQAEQIAMRLEREAALASGRSGEEGERGAGDAAEKTETPQLLAAAEAAARSLEDALAATAAALAAALSDDAQGTSAAGVRPWWLEADSRIDRVFERLPERVPPTPESPELTAQTADIPPITGTETVGPAPASEPRAIEPEATPPVTQAPAASSAPSSAPPAAQTPPPATPPPAFPARSTQTPSPVTPPRMEVPARLLLRRPREHTPESGHEIHARTLGAPPDAVPVEPEPLVIERVGVDRPVVIPPRVTPGSVGTPPGEGETTTSGESPVIPAADASAWVSRFIKPADVESPSGRAPASSPDEMAMLEAARRDEWKEMHLAATAQGSEAAAPAPPPEASEPEAAPEPAEPFEPIMAEQTPATLESEVALGRGRAIPAHHPAWPEAAELEDRPGLDRRWLWAGMVVAVLFGVGWLLGAVQWPAAHPGETRRGPLGALLQTLGFHGPHYAVTVSSQPDGAWIKVDGQELQRRTPSTIELSPGHHVVTLSFGQWGEVGYPLDGKKGDTRKVDGTLWGAIELVSPDPTAVIAVSIDDRPRGFAPLKVDSLAPGPHQVRFSGPGMASWGQTIEVKVGETQQVLARAVSSPSTGMLVVRAIGHVDGETGELKGAKVFLDGHPHGVTPQTVELARGPHSVRVEWQNETTAVQMIDLPGGNQRFATFDLGGGAEPPRFKLDAPARFPEGEPVVVSATLDGIPSTDVREMWLHVRGSEGTWERYPLSRLDSRLSAVGAITFPAGAFDAQGLTQWYVSITTAQGDEFYTELQDAALDKTKH